MIFLDTDIVVDLLRGRKPKVRDRYVEARSVGAEIALSAVALFELHFGAVNGDHAERNLTTLQAFLSDAVTIVVFDEAAARDAGSIRAEFRGRGATIGPYDILIAAHARSRSAMLVTANVGAFERVSGLNVIDWTA